MHPDSYVAFGDDDQGHRTRPELAVPAAYPDDGADQPNDRDIQQIVKRAKMEGALEVIAIQREWLRAAGEIGFIGQAVAWADAIKVFNESAFCAWAEKAGIDKARACAARERLHAAWPELRAFGQHALDRRQNESDAMRKKWRDRRKKKRPDANLAFEERANDESSAEFAHSVNQEENAS